MFTTIKYIWRHKGIVIVLLVLAAATWYYLTLHNTPFTQNAFIVANIRPVSALVEGYVTNVYVKNNQEVKSGDLLFSVYKPPYQLTVEELSNSLEAEKYNQQAIEFTIKGTEDLIKEKTAAFKNAEYLANQAKMMYEGNAVAEKYMEEAVRTQEEARSQLNQAQNTLNSAKQSYLKSAATQLQIQSQMNIAKINLELTDVRAFANGTVTNMFLTVGSYVKQGQPLFAFIETDTWWIQANFKETELSHLKPGQAAEIWLWQYPGKTFHGVVDEMGWGVDRKLSSSSSGMPVVQDENEWFLLPQRFPVQIKITEKDPKHPFHPGGSAFVKVDANADPLRQFFWQILQR